MAVRSKKIFDLIRTAAPEENAADWDNVGLLWGDPGREVEKVVLTLDVTPECVRFAAEEGAGLILAHHPLILSPLRKIDFGSSPGREISLLLENQIALYVAHTNADSSPVLSMNATIGKRLPMRDFGPAAAPIQKAGLKLVTFVPPESVDRVRSSLSQAGAGVIGEYGDCSFSSEGTGTFLGGEETSPVVGQKGHLEKVEEIRLEMVCPKNRLDRILAALWDSHPYEEVAYDLYPLSGYKSETHYLWKGELEEEMTLAEFASEVTTSLGEGIAPVKFAGPPERAVRTAAWCSGRGKDLVAQAANLGVDVYLTGDTGHHDALKALSREMALVDLDHYWSERFFMDNLREYLTQEMDEEAGVQLLIDPHGLVYRSARGE